MRFNLYSVKCMNLEATAFFQGSFIDMEDDSQFLKKQFTEALLINSYD